MTNPSTSTRPLHASYRSWSGGGLAIMAIIASAAVLASVTANAQAPRPVAPGQVGQSVPSDDSRPPAPTLTAPASATRAPDADGFLRRWLLLEPISVNGQLGDTAVRQTVAAQSLPGALTDVPGDGDTVTVGDATRRWHAVDTSLYNVNLYHFAYALEEPTSNVLFWAVTVVDAPREMRDVRLAIGSNAASIWWVNGEQVIDIYNDRQSVVDDGVSPRLTLRPGRNVIRAAIINAGGATDFCARFLDAGARPIRDLSIDLSR